MENLKKKLKIETLPLLVPLTLMIEFKPKTNNNAIKYWIRFPGRFQREKRERMLKIVFAGFRLMMRTRRKLFDDPMCDCVWYYRVYS